MTSKTEDYQWPPPGQVVTECRRGRVLSDLLTGCSSMDCHPDQSLGVGRCMVAPEMQSCCPVLPQRQHAMQLAPPGPHATRWKARIQSQRMLAFAEITLFQTLPPSNSMKYFETEL